MTLPAISNELARLCGLLDATIEDLVRCGHRLAQAEHDYRKAKAEAYPVAEGRDGPARTAWVDEQTAGLRLARDEALYDRQVALEALQSHRAQLSALQTVTKAHAAEAELTRYSPQKGP